MNTTFAGEMQLAGWSESHTGGCKVTFWLPSPDDLAAFRTLTTRKGNTAGHRFMAALVEIGDDEQPVQYPQGAVVPADKNMVPKLGPAAYWLVCRCGEPEFWNWLNSQTHGGIFWHVKSEPDAKECVCAILDIGSRREIDGNPEKEKAFHEFIRGPYSKWLAVRGVAA